MHNSHDCKPCLTSTMERDNAWLRKLIGRLSAARVVIGITASRGGQFRIAQIPLHPHWQGARYPVSLTPSPAGPPGRRAATNEKQNSGGTHVSSQEPCLVESPHASAC